MYQLHNVIVGAGALGLVVLLTCHTSKLPLPTLVATKHFAHTRQLVTHHPTGPVIQAWHPSVFDRMRQQPRKDSTNPVRFQRAMLNDNGDVVIDQLVRDDWRQQASTSEPRTTWAPFERSRVEQPLFHQTSRI